MLWSSERCLNFGLDIAHDTGTADISSGVKRREIDEVSYLFGPSILALFWGQK